MQPTKAMIASCIVIAMTALLCAPAQSEEQSWSNEPPVLPIGLDAYRMWDRLYLQRIGERAYMVSTYARDGGNRHSDSRNFIWMEEDENYNVTMDVLGAGVLYFKRTNHWHGSPWHYIVDGTTHMVEETGSVAVTRQAARETIDHSTFVPEEAFPEPLVYTWSTTHGANLMWVPIGFEESFRLVYSRTFYGTGYYIYKRYAEGAPLSQPIKAWDIEQRPDQDVIDLLNSAGSDIAPQDIASRTGSVTLDHPRVTVVDIRDAGPSVIRALKFTLPLEHAVDLDRLRLRVTWDDRLEPSINAPLALFYGTGTFYNRERTEHLVKGFPINVRYDYENETVELSCYYPMPFFKAATIELAGITPGDIELGYEVRFEPYEGAPNQASYFHATYSDFPDPVFGEDLTLLDTQGIQGEKEWSGLFMGTTFIFTHRNFMGTLEGDPRFFFDGARSPQAHGTGSEEWGGGGDYWGGRTMSLQLVGHPVGAPTAMRGTFHEVEEGEEVVTDKDFIHSAYRFLIADAMPFGNRAVINLEHGGWNDSKDHYEAVTYWYGLPAPSLVKTGELNIGNSASEEYHAYVSPDASDVQKILSRFDGLTVDHVVPPTSIWRMHPDDEAEYQKYIGRQVFPPHEEYGRYTRGTTEFSVHIEPDNHGALLRRTLDWSHPNQMGRVYIADASDDFNPDDPQWEYAGTWYTPGSNTYVYSPARGPLGDRVYNVRTSNRRFRDCEFLIPARLTQGRNAVRVRIEFVPVDRELFPGRPFPREGAWSEIRYEMFSYVMPRFTVE